MMLPASFEHLLHGELQFFGTNVCAIFDLHLETGPLTEAGNRRGWEREDHRFRNRGDLRMERV